MSKIGGIGSFVRGIQGQAYIVAKLHYHNEGDQNVKTGNYGLATAFEWQR